MTGTIAAGPGLRRKVATLSVMTAYVMTAYDTTAVTGAMPTIAHDLGGLDLYPWVFSASLLASTIAVPLFGKLADRHGRRPVFASGVALFLLGALLCGTARSMAALIACRALQGLGAGAISPTVNTISADLYTLEERAKVQGVFTGAWGTANALGPILGAWITLHFSWRWIFLVNLPIGLSTAVLLLASYVDAPRETAKPLDLAGAGAAALAIGAILFTVQRGLGFSFVERAATAVVAIVAGVLFVRRQRTAPDPLIPPRRVMDPVLRASVLGSFFVGGLIFAPTAYVPLWVTRELHGDVLRAGLALVPMLAGWTVGSTLGVPGMVRWGSRACAIGSLLVTATGASLLALTVGLNLPVPLSFASLVVLGFGLGPAANAFLLSAQMRVGWHARAGVTSMVFASRSLGGSLIIASLGALGAASERGALQRFVGLALVAWCGVLVAARFVPREAADVVIE